jgi:xanthine dehydrogenase YagR molybdenum-binding subunit
MTTTYIGRAQNRIDGPAKVTGEAKYAAEYDAPGLAHGWVVGSAIARGRITRIDAQHALAVPGVLRVFTHENRPEVASYDRSDKKDVGVPGSRSRPLYDERIHYSGQPIALVVAERLETARYAASLVRVDYEQERHVTDLHEERDAAYDPKDEDGSASAKDRGDAEGAFAQASVRHEAEYTHPFEHHNPMEMHASTVVWHDDGKLTVYEKTQGAPRTQKYLTRVFGLSKEDVRVVCSYVGGAFGSGLRAQYQLFLAVLAARELKRPVRVALTRQQMFTIGYRPDTIQRVALGANEDGTLQSIRHDAIGNTSRIEDFTENDVSWSAALYKCENIKRSYKVAKLDLFTPIDMRAPGGRPACTRSSARSTSSRTSSASTPSSCGSRTTRIAITTTTGRFRAARCGSAFGRALKSSAGRSAIPLRARCVRVTSSSAGGWQPAYGKRCDSRRPRVPCSPTTASSKCRARRQTSARERIPS